MGYGARHGTGGEIRVGRVARVAVRFRRWSLVDGVVSGEIVEVDPFHALEGEGVFRAQWGRGWLEIPVVGDLASGAVRVGETHTA